MSSSGYKRGLATAAVSALAITGIPFLAGTAHAEPIVDQYSAGQVELPSQFSGQASAKNDGQNTTVRLEAGAGADVTSVTFQYNTGNPNTWVTIATVSRNDDGAFFHEWDPTALNGATDLQIRAVGVTASTTDVDDTDVRTVDVDNTSETVNLTDGTEVGVFRQVYAGQTADNVIVSGTTSSAGGTVNLVWFGDPAPDDAPAEDPGYEAGNDGGTDATVTEERTFRGAVNIDGYDFTGSPDQVSIGASRETDDVETYTLYDQQITTVTAEPSATNVPAGEEGTVTVTVLDQRGNPIAGAEVRSSDNDEDTNPITPGVQGQDPQYTDENGEAVFTQDAGTEYYYANATDSDPYEPDLGDKRSGDVTVSQYNPAPTSLRATSRDGAAFDMDENNSPAGGNDSEPTDSDIKVQVLDQEGNQVDPTLGQTVNYYWVRTPFEGTAATPTRFPATGTWSSNDPADGNPDGTYQIAFPKNAPSGTFDLFASLSEVPVQGGGAIAEKKVLTVEAGQAAISYDEASPEQGPAGGTEVVDGQLALENGTGLVGRNINLTFQRDPNTANEDPTPDAGFLESNNTVSTSKTVTTTANGEFTVTVKDPAETPQRSEIGDNIDAATANGTSDNDNPAASKNDQGVDFLVNEAVGSVEITGGDPAAERPGELETYTVTVLSGDQDSGTAGEQRVPLRNQQVTLTTDHGYFTDGNPDPAPATGNDAGTYDNDGQSKTFTTDANGQVTFSIAIARDQGFDDDGDVTGTITATSGGVSDTQSQSWTSENPLNGGEVFVEFAPQEDQDSTVLPRARVGQEVNLVVRTTDQFGNRVGGELVTLTDNTNKADIEADDADTGTAGTQVLTDYDSESDATATATDEVDQKITGSWTTTTYRYTTSTGNGAPSASGTETLTDVLTINWYEAAEGTFTLDDNTGGEAVVGETVTMTVTAKDQDGQPIAGAPVEFVRNGPSESDGDVNYTTTTDANGEATYTFKGTEAGEADITAVVRDPDDGSQLAVLEDTVSFASEGRKDITAALKGKKYNGGAPDRMRVVTDVQAAGANVKLFEVVNGARELIARGVVNSDGKVQFVIEDLNGKKFTRYQARVQRTDTTKAALSNKKQLQ